MTRKYDAIIIHTGERDISIHFPNDRFVYADLRQAFEDQAKVTIEFKSRSKPRTLSQNSLFHAYCGVIAEETGNSLELVKSTLKLMFCKKDVTDKDGNVVVNPDTGEALTYIQKTSDMSKLEMTELIDNTRLFAAEWFKIYLPLPEEQIKLKLKK